MDISKEMAKLAYNALDEKKATDIKVIEIGEVSSIADYFIITNGNSSSQIQALLDSVEETLSKEGYEPKRVEGIHSTEWILMDYGDIIVHIFSKEGREFYNLERVWKNGKILSLEDLEK